MKEFFTRLFWKKPRDTSERSPPHNVPTLLEQINPPSDINTREAFQLRVSKLKAEAKARHMQGGDADVEQTMMELIAMVMTIEREDNDLKREQIADTIGLSNQDYMLAEAAILEPDKLFKVLPSWFELFDYDEGNFMEDLDAKAKIAITHRGTMPPKEQHQ